MALVKDRDTQRRDGVLLSDPVAANAVIFAGALYAINAAGFAVPATAVAAQRTRGVAQSSVNNTGGGDGGKSVSGRRGAWFNFKNSAAADEIKRLDIGADCYVVDDETVAKTSNTNARPKAGVIRDVDAAGVWVEV